LSISETNLESAVGRDRSHGYEPEQKSPHLAWLELLLQDYTRIARLKRIGRWKRLKQEGSGEEAGPEPDL
jgi:hypothetical protein